MGHDMKKEKETVFLSLKASLCVLSYAIPNEQEAG
jgi:hypothetical protein